MDNFYPFEFLIMFFSLFLLSFRGEKTSDMDDDIDDYWSGD